jgi:hypothetical protein
MNPSYTQNTARISNQIAILILCCISSRLVILHKVNDAPVQVSDIFDRTVSFNFINCSFQIYIILFLKCLLASRITLLNYLYCFGLNPVSTAFYSVSFDLNFVNVLNQNKILLLQFVQTSTLHLTRVWYSV